MAVKRDRTIPEICKKVHYRSYWQRLMYWFVGFAIMPIGFYRYTSGGDTVAGPVLMVLGLVFIWRFSVNLQELLDPFGGVLAKSITMRLDETVEDAFVQIDEDMALHGRKIGSVWIGEKWVLGREAMPLMDIRGIFAFKIFAKTWNYSLVLVDEDEIIQETPFTFRADLDEACAYLCELAPSAATGGMKAYYQFIGRDEEEREDQ